MRNACGQGSFAKKKGFQDSLWEVPDCSSSPDSLLQSHFFVSLGAPGGPPAKVVLKYQVQYKVSSFGFKRLRYVPLYTQKSN